MLLERVQHCDLYRQRGQLADVGPLRADTALGWHERQGRAPSSSVGHEQAEDEARQGDSAGLPAPVRGSRRAGPPSLSPRGLRSGTQEMSWHRVLLSLASPLLAERGEVVACFSSPPLPPSSLSPPVLVAVESGERAQTHAFCKAASRT